MRLSRSRNSSAFFQADGCSPRVFAKSSQRGSETVAFGQPMQQFDSIRKLSSNGVLYCNYCYLLVITIHAFCVPRWKLQTPVIHNHQTIQSWLYKYYHWNKFCMYLLQWIYYSKNNIIIIIWLSVSLSYLLFEFEFKRSVVIGSEKNRVHYMGRWSCK